MPRRTGAARRLLVGEVTYLWSVRHVHRAEGGCAETLMLHREGDRGSLRICFESGPGRFVPDGFLPSGAVASGETDLNLHTPGAARALLDVALARGWDPADPVRREVDGWTLVEDSAPAG